jgi:single-strand DNA-binding protein
MYQKLTFVGNLGRDPEMRYLPDGTAVTNLNVACNRKFTGKDGQSREQTTWYRVSAWGNQAEAANQYLSKGRQVLVEGELVPDPETGGPRLFTRQDGSIGASYEVRANHIQFLGGGNGNSNGSHASAPVAQEEDDIPF